MIKIEIKKNIKNSTGTITGYILISEYNIKIINGNKPLLYITEQNIINKISDKHYDIIPMLYDEYVLTIGEIACLYDVSYYIMNKYLLSINNKIHSFSKQGRRNSSYGQIFSATRRKNISKSLIGKPSHSTYIRTNELKSRISNTLKEKYASVELVQNPYKQSQAWKDGKYKNAKMGRGKQGYFYSIKNSKDFYFRSNLELYYMILLEYDNSISSYEVEPFSINMENQMTYTPDFLINKNKLIELKSRKFLQYLMKETKEKERFMNEINSAKKYCKEHNLNFSVVYDDEIKYNYRKFVKDVQQYVEKYNIRYKN